MFLITEILKDLGVVKTKKFVEVQRPDLVAGFIGGTAEKTREAIKKAEGVYSFSTRLINFGHHRPMIMEKKH